MVGMIAQALCTWPTLVLTRVALVRQNITSGEHGDVGFSARK